MNKHRLDIESISLIFLFICSVIIMRNTIVTYALNEQIIISSHEANVGSIVDVQIIIVHAESIAGGFIEFKFNSSVIVVEDIIRGDFGQPVAYINNSEGIIRIAVALATAVNKQNATMAIIRFKGVNVGYTDLIINKAELNDEDGNLIYPSYTSASVNIIPEFNFNIILIIGLLIIFFIFFQRQKVNFRKKQFGTNNQQTA